MHTIHTPVILVQQPTLAQAPASTAANSPAMSLPLPVLLAPSAVLLLVLIGGGLFVKFRVINELEKKVKFEEFKNHELKKKLKTALATITKMETNPDLVHSREFNLDYLRMRMEEEVFHFAVVNQIKLQVKEKVSMALRPTQAKEGKLGQAGAGRKVSAMFDVTYKTGEGANETSRVLFRIQIKLTKLPTQATSVTIGQIIDCIETYLSPEGDHNAPPTIQGRIVNLDWDQKAKPTPMLVLEQLNEGSNVTIRSGRRAIAPSGRSPEPSSGRSTGSTGARSRASATSKSRSSRSSSQSRR